MKLDYWSYSSPTTTCSSSSSSLLGNYHQRSITTTTTTTTMPDRDFNYTPADASEKAVAKGGVACPFPWRVHEVLKVARQEGLEHVISWAPHGKAFTVHKPVEFVDKLMTRFFCQTKFASFQRQLNLYGFSRFCHGRDKGAYYHPCFLRGQRNLVRHMIRRKIKGNASQLRRPMPQEEPNFYAQEGSTGINIHGSPPLHGHYQQQQQQQHPISPVPDSVSYQKDDDDNNNNNDENKEEEDEACRMERLFQREVSVDHHPEDPFTLFDEMPFHFFEECHINIQNSSNNNIMMSTNPMGTPTTTMSTPPPPPPATTATKTDTAFNALPRTLDPASELAKIREQIRQKRVEYEQTMGQPAPIRRVSLLGPPSHNIPLYKGSYISV
mmetsp:Transcript_11651/g.22264  ORF Transcript_11651/g.22264 Transcript_11651/m.22264 type:complete len:382 (-) Transcript_11651:258-1403(-)